MAEASYPALVLTLNRDSLALQGRGDPQKPKLTSMLQAVPILENHLAEVKRYVSGGPVIAEATSLGLPLALLEFTRQVGYRAVAFLPISHREDLAGLLVVGSPSRPLSAALIEPDASLADMVGMTLDRLVDTGETERRLAERDALTLRVLRGDHGHFVLDCLSTLRQEAQASLAPVRHG